MNNYYGFWLLFEKQTERQLSEIVSVLSKGYGNGEVFVPHLSIFPAVEIELVELTSLLKEHFSKQSKFKVETNGISYEDRWSKTLYIDIEINDELRNLNQKLEKLLGDRLSEENNYHPHVSLIYNEKLSDSKKEALKTRLSPTLPLELTIASLGIIDPGVFGKSWRDFGKWSVASEVKFI